MTADLDGPRLGFEAKSDRDDVRRAAATGRCQPDKPLPAQVFDLLLGERTHRGLLGGDDCLDVSAVGVCSA